MKALYRITVVLIIGLMLISACAKSEPEAIGLPNPASVNCEEKGGKVVPQKRGDGGEYGVCVFEGDRQCEEWALYRGECPEGGIDIGAYQTPASLYCAISGGTYAVTDKSGMQDEQGTCSFKNGKTCDVWEFYNGTCDSE